MIFIFISQQSFSSSTSKWLNPTTRKLLSKIFSQHVNNPETNPILASTASCNYFLSEDYKSILKKNKVSNQKAKAILNLAHYRPQELKLIGTTQGFVPYIGNLIYTTPCLSLFYALNITVEDLNYRMHPEATLTKLYLDKYDKRNLQKSLQIEP